MVALSLKQCFILEEVHAVMKSLMRTITESCCTKRSMLVVKRLSYVLEVGHVLFDKHKSLFVVWFQVLSSQE